MKNSILKKIIPIILFLYSLGSFACTCSSTNTDKSFLTSDFVAKIKILKKYENVDDSEFYKADIEILDLYKGDKVESILIYGNYKNKQDSACWIYTEENENLIIYANLNSENKETVYACGRVIYLDKVTFNTKNGEFSKQKIYDREIDILTTLKNNKIDYSNNGKIYFDISCFLRLIAIDLNNETTKVEIDEFGIFEFTIGKDFKVSKVNVIKGFNKKIDREIKKIIKQQRWTKEFGSENKLNQGIKSFVTINYKTGNNGYRYFRGISM